MLSSRPEPKPLRVGTAPNARPTGAALHSMHSAGGYDHANYSRRNWRNIIEEVTAHAEGLSIVPKGTGSVTGGTSHPSNGDTNTVPTSGISVKKEDSSVRRPWPLLWD